MISLAVPLGSPITSGNPRSRRSARFFFYALPCEQHFNIFSCLARDYEPEPAQCSARTGSFHPRQLVCSVIIEGTFGWRSPDHPKPCELQLSHVSASEGQMRQGRLIRLSPTLKFLYQTNTYFLLDTSDMWKLREKQHRVYI